MSRLIRQLRGVPASLWAYWGVMAGLLYGFALIAEEVIESDPIAFDQAVLAALDRWNSAGLDRLAAILDLVGGSFFLLPVTVLASIFLWRMRPRTGVFFWLAVFGAIALNGLAKLYFERARPDRFEALVPAEGYAFPSGHAMSSTAVALATYLVIRALAPAWRWAALILGGSFALAVGVSRSYLQVHYPSDVVAGWILATAWVLGVHIWQRAGGSRKNDPGAISADPEAPDSGSERAGAEATRHRESSTTVSPRTR